MKKVLISAPYMLRDSEINKVIPLLNTLDIEYDLADVEERLEEEDLLKIIGQYQGIICGDDRFTRKVYQSATNLEVIVKWGTGIDSLNEKIAKEFGIKLFRTPGAFTDPVADSTIALMLSEVRNLNKNDQILKNDGWDKPQGYTLSEKTIGIVGFGDIGQDVARKIAPFSPKVLAYDIQTFDDQVYTKLGTTNSTLEKIFEEADIITLHTDLNELSHHILNSETFKKMKKNPYIINMARGPLINEDHLIKALQDGQISGAGLDVFEIEPLPLTSPLRRMKNVLLSSHNSNSSPHCWERVHQNSVNMLKEGLGL